MEKVLVSDVMSRSLITANPEDNILDCAKKMVRKRVGSLLIVESKKLKGFISNQDILWALVKKPGCDLSKVKASDISPKKLITIKPSSKVLEAIKKMKKSKFYRLPVVQNGEVVGMITLKDILSFYPEAYSELSELEFIREETEKIKRLSRQNRNKPAVEDGICEECGQRGSLYRVNGILMCSSCAEST